MDEGGGGVRGELLAAAGCFAAGGGAAELPLLLKGNAVLGRDWLGDGARDMAA